jgi:SAM-dependent methyltransferase
MFRKIEKAAILARHIANYDPRHHAWHDYQYKFIQTRNDLMTCTSIPFEKARILIYGCGYHYPEVALFSSSNDTEGIDTAGAFYRDSLIKTAADLQRSEPGNPLLAPLKAWLKKNYYYRRYFRQLQKISGQKFSHSQYKLIAYDGIKLPYEDQSFDLVISNSVLEHVDDLDNGFRELARVTRPGGLSYHLWHNYYSFSGGHAPLFLSQKYPWGHLLGQYETPYLNRLTPDEIKDKMTAHFDLVSLTGVDRSYKKQDDPEFEFENEPLFNDEIRSQLPDLPREWFLTTAYLIIGRKS